MYYEISFRHSWIVIQVGSKQGRMRNVSSSIYRADVIQAFPNYSALARSYSGELEVANDSITVGSAQSTALARRATYMGV